MRAGHRFAPLRGDGRAVGRLAQPQLVQQLRKRSRSSARSMASGEVPRIGMPAASSARASFSGVWPPNWTITPSTSPLALLDPDQLEHVLGGERLEVEAVGGVVVGGDRLRVAVDHDGLVARPRAGRRRHGTQQ